MLMMLMSDVNETPCSIYGNPLYYLFNFSVYGNSFKRKSLFQKSMGHQGNCGKFNLAGVERGRWAVVRGGAENERGPRSQRAVYTKFGASGYPG